MTALLLFLSGNLWRTAALALAVALAVAAGLTWVAQGRQDAAEGRADALQTQLDAAVSQLAAARGSATNWETVARDLQVRLSEWVRQAAADRARDEAAVKAALHARAEADAAFAAWLKRYEDATRSEECAAQKRMKLC